MNIVKAERSNAKKKSDKWIYRIALTSEECMWLTNINTTSDEAKFEGRIEIHLLDQNGFKHVKHWHCKDLSPQSCSERISIFMVYFLI